MLTTVQAAILAAELSTLALAACLAIAVQLVRSSDRPAGRHAAPPTPPPSVPPASDGGERRRHADDWRQQFDDVPALDYFRVAPYVLPRAGVSA